MNRTGNKKIPVILDTDIGDDIDDTWALGMMLRCPELDVRMVLSATENTEYRAKIIARFLEKAARRSAKKNGSMIMNSTAIPASFTATGLRRRRKSLEIP